MKNNLESEINVIDQFKSKVKGEPILTFSELQEVIISYESLIQKLKAYQEIIQQVLKDNVKEKL